ncbi:MAG: DUF3303 domain-containing protein, partial [Terriglobia bacterium]
GYKRCYQLMETDDRQLLDSWMANWSDLMDFEVFRIWVRFFNCRY